MHIKNHWLVEAKRVPSPNYNERPQGMEPELVVIHCISLPPGQYGSDHIEQFFQNGLCVDEHPYFEEIQGMEVSSHLLVRRDGEIVQFVPFDKRAWHAGQSCYGERHNCNDFSIGIELEGTDDSPFEALQYDRLKQVIETLVSHYPTLNLQALTGHSDIAPGRKTDPGPHFDWQKLYQALGLS
ncbi:MAG: 1,6-anhydro-N-acetylmuramyl-L-alanine amidase AmpD [Pseudomonadota bacterium]|nr:1,6-anhydro-N-acetylmuramyl-L-alanine amidase AmpD [Pseudomonadota bacterium]